ncbi:MAG: carbohydrate ABC transporter permease [Chloroflexota bacterium]
MSTLFRRRRRETRLIEQVSPVRAIIAWIVGLLVFFPVLYIFVTGFKKESAALDLPPTIIPSVNGDWPLAFAFTFENYEAVLNRGFWPFFQNSIVVVTVSTLLVLALALPAAFALVWRHYDRGKNILFFLLSTKFLPVVGVIIALFYIAKTADVIDKPITLIILYTAMNLPIAIWMMRSFFDEIPHDVLDASRVDGATTRQEMFLISIPMVIPGLTATLFIIAIFAWNEFFLAVSLMAARGATAPMYMIGFVTSEGLFWAKLAAAGTMAMLPVIIIGWLLQRQLVRGLSMGAVK